MKILSYNILDGFQQQPSRVDAFLDYIAQNRHAVLSLNEYRVVDHNLAVRLKELGYIHSALNTTAQAANRSAIFSRLPFEIVSSTQDFRFLHIQLQGSALEETQAATHVEPAAEPTEPAHPLHLVNYHASPHGVDCVLKEASHIHRHLGGYSNIIITGDFNSLSPHDAGKFSYTRPVETIRDRYTLNGAVSYHFIEGLEQNGYSDLDDGTIADNSTVPTRIPRPKETGSKARLDYAYARLENGLSASSRVLKTAPFETLSDHYPLLISVAAEGEVSAL